MAPLQEVQDDALLAEQLQPMLKPARGPALKLSHICAAIILAHDETLSSRAACRGVTCGTITSLSSQNACDLCSMLRSHLHYRFRLLHK